jgi:hypothetical protein
MATAIVHVPKCGGTALRRQLEEFEALSPLQGTRYHFDASRTAIWGFAKRARQPSDGMSAQDRRRLFWDASELRSAIQGPGLVMGHISARAFRRLGATDIRAIVREPRIRLMSHFMFWRSMSSEWHAQYGAEQVAVASQALGKVCDFASSPRVDHNVIWRMANLGRFSSRLPPKTSFHLYWDTELSELVHSITGRKLSEVPLANVTESVAPYSLTPEDQDALNAATSHDMRFLQRAMDRGILTFKSRQQMDDELAAYLARFR